MPLDFIDYVEQGVNRLGSGGWLTPATVHGLTEADFVTMPLAQRQELFRGAAEFAAVARAAPNGDAAQEAVARAALTRIWELLRPYRTRESRAVRQVLWAAWEPEREWIPTFDYQLDTDWSGDPAVRVWLILKDGVDVLEAKTREELSRIRLRLHADIQDAEIDRWPFVRTRSWSEVTGPNALVPV